MFDDLTAELVPHHDVLVGAHEVRIAGLQSHVCHLVAVMASMKV